jgi:hypothetical protein
MGGGKGQAQKETTMGYQSDVLSQQMLQDLFNQTAPIRQAMFTDWNQLLSGQPSTYMNTAFGSLRGPVEQQYATAKENVLANTPRGGGLFDQLTNVETARAQNLSDILGRLYIESLNKAYGAAWNAPTTTISGLQTLGEHGIQTASEVSQGVRSGVSACCFNFLEAEGEIYWTVRLYRDQHYKKDSAIPKGYVYTAKFLVPLMKRSNIAKKSIQFFMTRPLRAYSSWYYGENRSGFVFWPFKLFWTQLWRILGR